jgi:hypothetical protein
MKIVLRPSSRHSEKELQAIVQGYINTFSDLNSRLIVRCDNDKVVVENNEDSSHQVNDDTSRFLVEEIEREFSDDVDLIECKE